MKGGRTLHGKPFRYGGIDHNFDDDVEEWISRTDAIKDKMRGIGLSTRNPYRKCFACGGKMRNRTRPDGTLRKRRFPYCACFKRRDGRYYIAILCRACAYLYGRGVIEMDGETYQNPWEFSEEQYKKELNTSGADAPTSTEKG